MSRSLGALALVCVLSAPALADHRRDQMFYEDVVTPPPLTAAGKVPYNTIFLNRCAGGCALTPNGGTNSTTTPDGSSLAGGNVRIQAFKGTDAQWQHIVDCVKDTFSVFNVNVTDVDPGSASHFEIMIAGYSSDLQNPNVGSNTFGVSPFTCSSSGYLNNALVFAFANQFIDNPTAFGTNPIEEEICATAAQEISHAWTLDHVVVNSDPMTYKLYVGRRYFAQGGVQCGSDCVGGKGPFGQTCTGQNHACACTNQQTQNEIATIDTLFGAGPGTPPTVTITSPHAGDTVQSGFSITATSVDNGPQPMSKVELRIDGNLIDMQTSGSPNTFVVPTTVGEGQHTIEVTSYDQQLTPGKASIQVTVGPPCTKDSQCGMGDVCIGGRCVAGPTVAGGLGMPCSANTDCASQVCGSDGTNSYCVDPCMTGQCPSGFSCLLQGSAGVCWPGGSDGGGGGGCDVAPGGAISSGLLFGALVLTRRRRRR